MGLVALSKLFSWSVNHTIRKQSGRIVQRTEKGIVRAENKAEAKDVLQKMVYTCYSANLIIIEIPDNIKVYSISYTDNDISE